MEVGRNGRSAIIRKLVSDIFTRKSYMEDVEGITKERVNHSEVVKIKPEIYEGLKKRTVEYH